jgi:hypothetical protein
MLDKWIPIRTAPAQLQSYLPLDAIRVVVTAFDIVTIITVVIMGSWALVRFAREALRAESHFPTGVPAFRDSLTDVSIDVTEELTVVTAQQRSSSERVQ